ncbi:class I SAM-dependent methyltransferase [Phaeodactylibacter xiamenensis]|uniref:class I SAM-dependent methyltransferase n=1 Tax=Phaeodactylibacter xiamenensis TaxID=1524460 RepID=UPI003BA929C5
MNYKLLFPTYRNRYLFVRRNLKTLSKGHHFGKALNLGTGEGDYDPMISQYCEELISCDINEQDIAYARQLNAGLKNVTYRVEDALNLSFPDNYFDLITSVDVIEHVGKPERMIEEVQRVLKPNGIALITFPSLDFPLTYDPINRVLSWFSEKRIPQGAYAFGHEYLVSKTEFRQWSDRHRLSIMIEQNLSGYIIGLLEMYWTGIVQRIFKANATNLQRQPHKGMALRPSTREPFLTKLTDLIIAIDHALFRSAAHSVGKGFIIKK